MSVCKRINEGGGKMIWYLCGLVCCVVILILYLISPAQCNQVQKTFFENKYFAHRGLHTKDRQIPENSLTAFRCAVDKGYGIELDIQLSKDGQVVVFHDDSLQRVCGVVGAVKDHTFESLQTLPLMETDERMPLLQEVLDCVNGQVPLIIELKTGSTRLQLCEVAFRILHTYKGPYCIESFDPRIVAWFHKHAPDITRGQLTDAKETFKEQPRLQQFILSHVGANCIARPHFIAHGLGKKSWCVRLAEVLGAQPVSWTVTSEQLENDCCKPRANIIFEGYEPQRSTEV